MIINKNCISSSLLLFFHHGIEPVKITNITLVGLVCRVKVFWTWRNISAASDGKVILMIQLASHQKTLGRTPYGSVGVEAPNGHSNVVIFLEFWCLIYSMMHMNYSKSKTSPVWAPTLN